MSFGLEVKQPILEHDKKDWVEYEGVFYPKRTVAAMKAAKTRQRNIHYAKYKTKPKQNQREILVKLMDKALLEFDESNVDELTETVGVNILFFETPAIEFIKTIDKYYKGKKREHLWKTNAYIPNINDKESDNIVINIVKQNYPDANSSGCTDRFHKYKKCQIGFMVLPESYAEFLDYYNRVKRHNQSFKYGCLLSNIYPGGHFNFAFIWTDYCGGFSKYKKDIENTFRYKILANRSIYAMTFCTRDPIKKNTSYSTMNCIVAVQDYVKKIGKRYGYETEFLTEESGLYSHHMYTAIFRCIYNPIEETKDELKKMIDTIESLKNQVNNKLFAMKENVIFFEKQKEIEQKTMQ